MLNWRERTAVRVELAADVFTGPEELCPILELVSCFVERRHDWILTDPAVLVAAIDYFGREAPGQAASVELAAKSTVRATAWSAASPGSTPVLVTRSTIANLAHDLCRAAILVVEDLTSDRHFFRTVAQVFAPDLIGALDDGWLEIRHGGGSGGVYKVAVDEAQRFRELCRVVVLLDSDRMVPEQSTSSHDKADALKRSKIRVHVLELREAENYVPNKVLAATVRDKESARVLALVKKLTPEQRGHFDFKKGFGGKGRTPTIPQQQRRLYGSLEESAVRTLSDGFGTGLLATMHDRYRAGLTEEDFSGVGPSVAAELRALVALVWSVV